MSPKAVDSKAATRINQVYRAHLRSAFKIEYYRTAHSRLADRSKHIDFLIGLGAATSGGSGLGILAYEELAWLCAVLTTISTVGAVAKGTYDWTGRLQKYIDMIEYFTPMSLRLRNLAEDIRASEIWNGEFEATYAKIRTDYNNEPTDSTKDLPTKIRRQIQDEIRARTDCRSWWAWQES